MYAVDVSPDLISTVTDGVVAEVTAWQARPLEPMYPVVFFDALRVKIRDEAVVRSKAVYLALAVLPDGTRDVLGIWIEQTEGAKFWMKVFTDLKTRGCQDILIAVTDGLKGMSEALAAVYPATTLQTCIVHLLRNSLEFANWKERKPLAAALRPIYTAASADAALLALDAFERGPWGVRFPTVVAAWRRAWTHVIPFFAFPPEVRRIIYTTNALESLHAQLRKIIKTRGHFPNDEAATKLMWLALRNITGDGGAAPQHVETRDEPVRDPRMGIASRRRPRRMARSGVRGMRRVPDGQSHDRTETRPHRRPQERRSRAGPGSSIPLSRLTRSRCETKIDAAMEMTLLWKSQNDFHKSLEISLENARFPHSHSRSSFVSDEKRRPKNERYEVNHVSHTKILTRPNWLNSNLVVPAEPGTRTPWNPVNPVEPRFRYRAAVRYLSRAASSCPLTCARSCGLGARSRAANLASRRSIHSRKYAASSLDEAGWPDTST